VSKLKFRRAGLDALRVNNTLRALVRLTATAPNHAGNRRFALFYLSSVACSDNGIGTVTASPRELAAFARAHQRTLIELLAEIIGKESAARFESEL
jgi:hypothetical protein